MGNRPIKGSLLEDLHIGPLKTRTQNILLQNRMMTWGDLLTYSPLAIGSLQNSGATTVRESCELRLNSAPSLQQLQAGVRRGAGVHRDVHMGAVEEPIRNVNPEPGSVGTPGDRLSHIGEAIDSASNGLSPPDIAMILTDIRSSPLESHALPFDASAMVLSTVLGQLDDIDQRIILKRTLSAAPPTLEELGREIGVTRERVRQIQVHARREISNDP